MAQEIRQFQVKIPAGTAKTAGFSADMSFPPRIVTEIEVRVPPGPRGEVGFAIGSAGVPVIPYQSGTWIVTDDADIHWPLENYVDSGSWTLFGYNTGSFDHTLYVTFLLATQAQAASSLPAPIDPAQLVGDGSTTFPTTTPPMLTPPPLLTPPPITTPSPILTPPPPTTPPPSTTPAPPATSAAAPAAPAAPSSEEMDQLFMPDQPDKQQHFVYLVPAGGGQAFLYHRVWDDAQGKMLDPVQVGGPLADGAGIDAGYWTHSDGSRELHVFGRWYDTSQATGAHFWLELPYASGSTWNSQGI